MILQLLKKLRTTRRTPTNTANVSIPARRKSLGIGAPHAWLQCGVAAALISLSAASPSVGQTFRPPALQSPSAINLDVVQAKFEHAEALRRQMERAASEQRAPNGFANKAYEAQQAYLAELAYDEYRAYASKAEREAGDRNAENIPPRTPRRELASSSTQYAYGPSSYSAQAMMTPTAQPAMAEPASSTQLVQATPPVTKPPVAATPLPSQPSRYTPPVHAAPPKATAPVTMSFGDVSPTGADVRTVSNQTQSEDDNFAAPAIHHATINPNGIAQVTDSEFRGHVESRLAAAKSQTNGYGTPLPLNHRQLHIPPTHQPMPRLHSPVAQNVRPQQQQRTMQQQPTMQQEMQQVVSANHRKATATPIASPHADVRPFGQPTQRQPAIEQPVSRQATSNIPVYVPKQRSFVLDDKQVGLQDRIASLLSRPEYKKTSNSSEKSKRYSAVPQPRRVPGKSIGVAQRLTGSPANRGSVQQAAMVRPVQDDGFEEMHFEFDAEAELPRPPIHVQPALNGPRVAQQSDDRFRQISILRQEQDDANQFGGQAEPSGLPAAQDSQPGPFGAGQDDEIKRINDDLTRQLQEQKNALRGQDTESEAERINRMVEEMERQAEDETDDSGSVLDDDDSENKKPSKKTCNEFRTQLLASSIRDIALDISPQASSYRDQYTAISRSWTDRSGQVIATGAMTDLRRGYVIIETGNGAMKIPYGKLSDNDLAAIAEYWRIPETCTVGGQGLATRAWVPQTYTWKATSLCHKPLYFENIQLERYGHSHGPFMQPVHSVAHFFSSLATMPMQTAVHPPNECRYALGLYRPGDCAPWLKEPVGFTLSGLRRQALFVTGAAFIP